MFDQALKVGNCQSYLLVLGSMIGTLWLLFGADERIPKRKVEIKYKASIIYFRV